MDRSIWPYQPSLVRWRCRSESTGRVRGASCGEIVASLRGPPQWSRERKRGCSYVSDRLRRFAPAHICLGVGSVQLQGIRTIHREGYQYKKAGVMLTGLVPRNRVQSDLFDSQNRERSKRLMGALDAVNERWGTGALAYASSGINKEWKTQFHRRSPAYTTDWKELPVILAR
jgi:hypothetical protein